MKLVFTVLIAIIVFFCSNVFCAENYISDEPPSDSLLAKFVVKYAGETIVGKFKHSDTKYDVLHTAKSGNKYNIEIAPLIKLESNIWLIKRRKEDWKIVKMN